MKKVVVVFIVLISVITSCVEDYDNSSYLSDYDYMWTSLEENYPYFPVLERSFINWREIRNEFRVRIANNYMSDETFSNLLKEMISQLGGNGHLSLLSRDFYHMARYVYTDAKMEEWVNVLSTPNSESFYIYEENYFDPNESFENGNVEYELFKDESIAYVNIKSFKYQNVDLEKDILYDIYSQIEGYDNLIIDIRENGGGSTSYYRKNIVEPLSTKKLYFESYMLYSNTETNKAFIKGAVEDIGRYADDELSHASAEILNADQLPEFPLINQSDLIALNKVLKKSIELNPNNEFDFNGRIWLLVGERVYSASDEFAQMCKQTGFATLIGHVTGGDGIGLDPVLLSLPNTGVIIRFSAHYGLNSNGQNNEEYGTTPDILLDYDVSAYEKVLELIRGK